MPARWWSIQWVTSRLFYAVVAAIVVSRNLAADGPFMYFGGVAIITAVLFAALTVIAWYYRRRWARQHS